MSRLLYAAAGFAAGVAYRERNEVDYVALEAATRAAVRAMPGHFERAMDALKAANAGAAGTAVVGAAGGVAAVSGLAAAVAAGAAAAPAARAVR